MKELFYEESTNLIDKQKEKKKYVILNFFTIFFYVVFILFLIYIIATFEFSKFKNGFTYVLFYILGSLVPLVFLFLTGFYMGKLRNKYYNEYDYTFVSGSIRISKIIMNKKRILLYKFDSKDIQKIGKYGSPEFEKYTKIPKTKVEYLTSNNKPTEDKDFYYIMARVEGENKLLVIECTENLITSILKFTNITVLERVKK